MGKSEPTFTSQLHTADFFLPADSGPRACRRKRLCDVKASAPHPSAQRLSQQARGLRSAHQSGDAAALARFHAHLPRLAQTSDEEIRTTEFFTRAREVARRQGIGALGMRPVEAEAKARQSSARGA